MTISEVARILKVSRESVRRLIRTGQLAGGNGIVEASSLRAYAGRQIADAADRLDAWAHRADALRDELAAWQRVSRFAREAQNPPA